MRLRALALAALLAPAAASAHDLWLERDGEGLALRRGHRGGARLAIDRATVRALRCLDGGASRDLLGEATFAPSEVRLASRCAAASAALDRGAWSLTPDGEVNKPRSQVPNAVRGWSSRQYAKWVEVGGPGAGAVLGDELELVAEGDLGQVRQGGQLTVRLLHRGRPAAGAAVAVDHGAVVRTDAAGEARVTVRSPGVETVLATLRLAGAAPQDDVALLQASLSFQVAR